MERTGGNGSMTTSSSGAGCGTVTSVPPPGRLDLPFLLERLCVHTELGLGGMGQVVEAHDPKLGRDVAIKVLRQSEKTTPGHLARFEVEARITSQLEHPNIVPVYEIGQSVDGHLFFVMKRVDGLSLRQILKALRRGETALTRRWTRHRLLSAFVQVCEAVAYAHARGVVHRDLKPGNLMLGVFGEVFVMDWGLALVLSSAADLADTLTEPAESTLLSEIMDGAPTTHFGAATGTPGYMSPEQAAGRIDELDGRSDIWSLGAILYEILALEGAYRAPTRLGRVVEAAAGLPEDPRLRNPGGQIPAEIAAICMRALDPEPERRFGTAMELADAVRSFLDGSKRRTEAARFLADAREQWRRCELLVREQEALRTKEVTLGDSSQPSEPLEARRELWDARRRIARIGPELAEAFAETVGLAERALARDPDHAAARAFLADVHLARFAQAEDARDVAAATYFRRRALAYDDEGVVAEVLAQPGSVTLLTEPSGARVTARRFDRDDVVWTRGEPRSLGTTPVRDAALPAGSWLLEVTADGCAPMTYPVHVRRRAKWTSGPEPVPLLPADALDEAFVYVPPGPWVRGGDAQAPHAGPRAEGWLDGFVIARDPVTAGEYAAFLTDLHGRDPAAAAARVPRVHSALEEDPGGRYWPPPCDDGVYRVPEADRDGHRWDPSWPIGGISWEDAEAYADWLSERVPGARLVTSSEHEKAARGVDGRCFPWGDEFDPALCAMRYSSGGSPEPVGAFRFDVSVYGVRDLAGSMATWCADLSFAGDPTRRTARGGSWISVPWACRAAARYSGSVHGPNIAHGIRIALDLPD